MKEEQIILIISKYKGKWHNKRKKKLRGILRRQLNRGIYLELIKKKDNNFLK